jgi:hypothetical protein
MHVCASLRHELNNLLCRIMGSAELTLDRVTDKEARDELLTLILCAGEAARLLERHLAEADERS